MGWLGTYEKRIKLSIDADLIDNDLVNFPILIYLSTASGISDDDVSCVFDEIAADANRLKIAVTTSDGTTECYVEIEQWDDANEQAWLWVKVPAVDADVDTDLYLYYDATQADNNAHVGDTNSAVAENVWDANFQGVWHMRDGADNQHIYDSTTNDYDGTKGAVGEPTVMSCKISQGQDYDGGDSIRIGDVIEPAKVTVEAWVYHSVAGGLNDRIVAKEWGASAPYVSYNLDVNGNSTLGKYGWELGLNGVGMKTIVSTTGCSAAAWRYVVGVYDQAIMTIYVNGAEENHANWADTIKYSAFNLNFGADLDRTTEYLEGKIDEVRISGTDRSAAWIKASYNSGNDSLIEFGTEVLYGWDTGKIDGVDWESISKIDGVARTSISKVDGV